MASKKSATERTPNLPRRSDYTETFVQTWNRLNRAGKVDMARIEEVMISIMTIDAPLGGEWKEHGLQGQDWKGCRECHVGGDLLLVYQIRQDGSVVFVDAGSHSELFG